MTTWQCAPSARVVAAAASNGEAPTKPQGVAAAPQPRSAKRRAAEVRVPLKLRHELYSPRVAFAVAFEELACT